MGTRAGGQREFTSGSNHIPNSSENETGGALGTRLDHLTQRMRMLESQWRNHGVAPPEYTVVVP